MADPEVRILGGATEESGDVMEVGETGADDAPGEEVAEDETAIEAEKPAARVTFVE